MKKKNNFLFGPGAFLLLAVAMITLPSLVTPSGSFSNLHIESQWPIDTLTNTEADTLVLSKFLDYSSDLSLTLHNFELSGTATALYVVQQSATANSTVNWITTDTLSTATATTTAHLHFTNNPEYTTEKRLWGYRVRVIGTNSGTGVHRYNINAIARRRLD
jgi:hypothetical protein